MGRFLIGVALAAGLAGVSAAQTPETAPEAPAADAGAMITRITGDEMAAILTEIGWSATVQIVDDKPMIASGFTDSETGIEYTFNVGLYRCDDAKACYDVMFMRSAEASRPVTLMMVNKYNASQMFGVAYMNDDGTLGVSMTQTIQGGVTRQNLKEMADWWKTVITGFDAKVTGG